MSPSDEGRQRVGPLTAIPALLRELGADPTEVLRSVGLSADALDDSEGVLTYSLASRLLEASVAHTNCNHFGLLVGQRNTLKCMGAVGRLMSSAPDVRTSLIDLVNAHHMNARGAITYLITLRDTALMGYGIHLSDVVAHDQIADLIMALGWNYLSELADVQPCEILLARAAPSDLRPYRRVFACPIRFEAEQTALVLPLSALARPNFGADAATHAEMQRHISRVWADREPIVRTRLLRLLWPRVVMLSPRVEEMAGRLAMHSRTLNRRLHLEGTSYREVLNEARREIACQLLAHTHLGVTQIALALGYDDPNAFTHAFSRWTGLSPSDWRATPQSDPSQNAVRQTSPAEPPVVDLAVSGDMQN